MPNCVVKGCNSQSARDKKKDGITFHTFPNRDQNVKEKWIAVVRDSRNEPLWLPTFRSVVCSNHFRSDDLYYTEKGLRRVKQDRFPKILPGIPEQLSDEDLSQPSTVVQTAAVPDLSLSDVNQSYASCAISPGISDCLNNEDLGQPPTDVLPGISDCLNNEDLRQPGTEIPGQPLQDPSIFDTPRKFKLRKKVSLLEKKLKNSKRKIKSLNQKIRRLTEKNKSLKAILENL